MKYKIHNQKYIHTHFFKIKEAELQFNQFDGTQSNSVTRYAIDKGPAAASIIFLKDIKKFVLVKQFRYPMTLLPKVDPWIYEIVAGTIDGDENPEDTIRREIQEEAGYVVEKLELIQELYLSPGISSECVYLFFATTTSTNTTITGDPHDEDEDIKVELFDPGELQNLISKKQLKDAKTLVAAQYSLLVIRSLMS